jgi:hypothetical protein
MADKPKKPKKSNPSGKHKTKRVGVNFTEEWHATLTQLAARRKMPVLWYLIDLAKADADQAGIPTPAVPWDKDKPADADTPK